MTRLETADDHARRRLRELDEELPYIRAGKPLPPEFQRRHDARRMEQAEFYTHVIAPAVDALITRVKAGTDSESDRRILAHCGVSRETFRND